MTHGSLFSGIGGFDLAAQWMGWENKFHCEWNEFGKRVLNYYWPKAESYGDITKTDFTIWRGRIDILTGGFPCQPYSTAGKRLGKADERHLWPEMLRAIREIQPRYIVGENVYGLINWNGGLVFNEVQADLEAIGYKIQPVILPACSVNAPHRRERVWFVAYSDKCTTGPSGESARIIGQRGGNNDEPKERREPTEQHIGHGNVYGITSNANNTGNTTPRSSINGDWTEAICEWELSQHEFSGQGNERINSDTGLQRQAERQEPTMGIDELRKEWTITNAESFQNIRRRQGGFQSIITRTNAKGFTSYARCSEWQNWLYGKEQARKATKFGDSYTKFGRFVDFPTVEPTIRGGNDGIPRKLDGITFPKWRNESIKAYGNAIVPQVAFQIFKAIGAHERLFYGCQ